MDMFQISEIGHALVEYPRLVQEVESLKGEVKYWRDKYNEHLNQSLQHGQQMMGNFLKLALEAPDKIEAAFGNKGE